ncbi:MAG: tetratricopeptide repeat protein [Lachnospiraceae bacterium]|nr:tetratricopeptide repeat protein [Lachnospiraceae bacterium]
METTDGKKKKGTWALILTMVLAVAAVLAVVLVVVFGKAKLANPKTMGDKALEDRNYAEAITYYKEALEKDPMDAQLYLSIAKAYDKQGDVDAAYHMLEKGYRKTEDAEIEKEIEKMAEDMSPILTDTGSGGDDGGTEDTPRQRQIALLQQAYELLSAGDYEGMCDVDGSEEADLVIAELKGDHVIYIPEEQSRGTGVGTGVYRVASGYFFYYGEFVNGERKGHGVSFWWNGHGYETYDGEWNLDAPNGRGTASVVELYGYEERYTGNFVDGLEDGDFIVEKRDDETAPWQQTEITIDMGSLSDAVQQELIETVEEAYAKGEDVDPELEDLYQIFSHWDPNNYLYAIFDDGSYLARSIYDEPMGALGYR